MTENTDKLYQKLLSEMEKATWGILVEKNDPEIMVYVDNSLDMVDVGVRMAMDDVASIKTWLDSKAIQRPDEELQNTWKEQDESELKEFNFIIVQPYIVIQDYKEIEKPSPEVEAKDSTKH